MATSPSPSSSGSGEPGQATRASTLARIVAEGIPYLGVAFLFVVIAATVAFAFGTKPPAPSCGHGGVTPQSRWARSHDAQVYQLAKKFEPTVKMSRLDGYWPVSLWTVLQERGPAGQRVQLMSKAGDTLADPAKRADLRTSGLTGEYLQYPAVLTDKTGQRNAFLTGAGVSRAKIDGWPNADMTQDVQRTGQIYFYDGGTHCSYPGAKTGDRALEYWFFYGLNYYPVTVDTVKMLNNPLPSDSADIDFHEGDWEHIAVLIPPNADTPDSVWLARHSSEGKMIRWPEMHLDGTHPIIYPAFGGHPSYPNCGAQARALLAASVYDYVPCGPGVYTLNGGNTPLVDLATVSWSCWPGHFGTAATGTGPSSNADDPTGAILVAGPNSPLRQAENTAVCPSLTAKQKAG